MYLDIILLVLIILGVGWLCRKAGILTASRVTILNKAAFYVALPALVFYSTGISSTFKEILSPLLALGYCTILFLTLGVGWFVHREVDKNAKKSVAITQSYHGNLGYMGLPVVTAALGQVAGGKASFLLGIGSTIQIPITMSILVHLNQTKSRICDEVRTVALNPVLPALIAGLAFSCLNLSIPGLAEKGLHLVAESALPIAMLGVGATIKLKAQRKNRELMGSVLGLKILFMPLLGWLTYTLMGLGALETKVGILMLGMPVAISTFIYAKELGGDEELASLNISLTTLISLATITVLLLIF